MTTAALCARMEEMDIPCGRKTLSQDIAILNEIGIEVMHTLVGRSLAYYSGRPQFHRCRTKA